MRALVAQTGAEVYMTLRRGETLLLTVGIPVVFLLFFSTVHVVSTPHQKAVDFFVPGILALAVMSTAMVTLGIATGFERGAPTVTRRERSNPVISVVTISSISSTCASSFRSSATLVSRSVSMKTASLCA